MDVSCPTGTGEGCGERKHADKEISSTSRLPRRQAKLAFFKEEPSVGEVSDETHSFHAPVVSLADPF